jgi:hypothetical protein
MVWWGKHFVGLVSSKQTPMGLKQPISNIAFAPKGLKSKGSDWVPSKDVSWVAYQ